MCLGNRVRYTGAVRCRRSRRDPCRPKGNPQRSALDQSRDIAKVNKSDESPVGMPPTGWCHGMALLLACLEQQRTKDDEGDDDDDSHSVMMGWAHASVT